MESEIEPETMHLQAVGGLMRSLLRKRLTACLLHNEPASYRHGQGEASCRAVAKASLNRAIQSVATDAKRDDLPMARVKLG